jgi:predicted nucleic acid-binding protein
MAKRAGRDQRPLTRKLGQRKSGACPPRERQKFHGFGRERRGFARAFWPEGLFRQVKGIADTGFLVAFLARRDRYHRWAVNLASCLEEPFITCEAVLAEAAYHVQDASKVLALVRSGMLRVDFDVTVALSRLEVLADQFADRSPDLADLCLICLSEKYPDYPVVTVDSDFRVYRRFKRQAIPVVMPSA